MPINNGLVFIEEPEDVELNERLGKFRRNGEWLTEHGTPLFEQYAGLHIAVSEGEVFVAADASLARQMAQEKHPEDEPFVQHVPIERMERIYAC